MANTFIKISNEQIYDRIIALEKKVNYLMWKSTAISASTVTGTMLLLYYLNII